MQVNSNIYAFLSGILVSLATNIFATLCFEPMDLAYRWHQYSSTLLLISAGALCMYISVKVVGFQEYIATRHISDPGERREIIEDATAMRKGSWVVCYALSIILLIAGLVMLGLPHFTP
jgi:uncharacterized membrane protein HdeD (DUF308 family)